MLDKRSKLLGQWGDITFRVLLLAVLAIIAWRIPSIPSMPSRLNVDARVYTSPFTPILTKEAGKYLP